MAHIYVDGLKKHDEKLREEERLLGVALCDNHWSDRSEIENDILSSEAEKWQKKQHKETLAQSDTTRIGVDSEKVMNLLQEKASTTLLQNHFELSNNRQLNQHHQLTQRRGRQYAGDSGRNLPPRNIDRDISQRPPIVMLQRNIDRELADVHRELTCYL